MDRQKERKEQERNQWHLRVWFLFRAQWLMIGAAGQCGILALTFHKYSQQASAMMLLYALLNLAGALAFYQFKAHGTRKIKEIDKELGKEPSI